MRIINQILGVNGFKGECTNVYHVLLFLSIFQKWCLNYVFYQSRLRAASTSNAMEKLCWSCHLRRRNWIYTSSSFQGKSSNLINYLPNECKILSHLSLEMEYWQGLSIKYNYKSPLLRSRILTMSSVQGFFSLALHFFIFRNNFAII